MKWHEDKAKAFISIDARDLKDEKIEITSNRITIDYVENGKHYKADLQLKNEVDETKSFVSKTAFCATIVLVKKEEKKWNYLTVNDKAIANLKYDWDKFVDSEDENAKGNDMPNFGGFPGMEGLGGMGGMGGMPNFGGLGGDADEDDEDEEEEKPKANLEDLEGAN